MRNFFCFILFCALSQGAFAATTQKNSALTSLSVKETTQKSMASTSSAVKGAATQGQPQSVSSGASTTQSKSTQVQQVKAQVAKPQTTKPKASTATKSQGSQKAKAQNKGSGQSGKGAAKPKAAGAKTAGAKSTGSKGKVSPQAKLGKTVIVDPGHGAVDFGAQSKGCVEKDLNLKTAQFLKKYLTQKGYRVILTRARDEFVSLTKRAEIANKSLGDLFVSVHFNAAKAESAHGIEVYYYNSKNSTRKTQSHKLAQDVLAKMIASTSAKSRGVKEGNFCVIRETTMPAILVEGGFITNAAESKRLQEEKYLDKLAFSIADSVDRFLK